MKILCISGKARHGKDFTAENLAEDLRILGKKVLITHNADLLKFMCKNLFGWNGEKDEKGRHILQYVGTDVVRKKTPDFWVDFLISVFNLFPNEWDYVIIPDCRFPNEIEKLKESGFDVTHIRVERITLTTDSLDTPIYSTPFDNGLTEEAKSHISETALDNYPADINLINPNNWKYGYKNILKCYAFNIVFGYNIIFIKENGEYKLDDVIHEVFIKNVKNIYKTNVFSKEEQDNIIKLFSCDFNKMITYDL